MYLPMSIPFIWLLQWFGTMIVQNSQYPSGPDGTG